MAAKFIGHFEIQRGAQSGLEKVSRAFNTIEDFEDAAMGYAHSPHSTHGASADFYTLWHRDPRNGKRTKTRFANVYRVDGDKRTFHLVYASCERASHHKVCSFCHLHFEEDPSDD